MTTRTNIRTSPLFWGLLASFIALVFESFVLIISQQEVSLEIALGPILLISLLAMIEETSKFFFIFQEVQKATSNWTAARRAFSVGLGFSLGELIFKSLSFGTNVLKENTPALIFHITLAAFIGFLIFQKKEFSPFYHLSLLFLAFLDHFFFNFFFILFF